MRKRWIMMLAVAVTTVAVADKKPVKKPVTKLEKEKPLAKGFWKILVKPGARWVLHESIEDKRELAIETYDVRKIDGADVARLRWTLTTGKEKQEVGDSAHGRFDQVAVTEQGLYLLSADMDDAKVAAALKKPPSRSDPPKPYAGTKQNNGRYLMIMNGNACLGEGPLPGAGDCPDTCDGTLCISPTDGVVSLMGNWAPGVSVFER